MNKELKRFLDEFAQKNQYYNWEAVKKDNQSVSFTAQEFEEIVFELFEIRKHFEEKSQGEGA